MRIAIALTAASAFSLGLLSPPASASTAIAQHHEIQATQRPPIAKVMAAFRDQWGQTAFPGTGVVGWLPGSSFTRRSQFGFDPGTDETNAKPKPQQLTRRLTYDLVQRTINDTDSAPPPRREVEHQIVQDIVLEDGTHAVNRFPTFLGTRASFTFYNTVAHPPLPGEFEHTCRTLRKAGAEFLLCRVIRPDRGINYQVNIEQGTDPGARPTDAEVLNVFRDQWSRTTFPRLNVTNWEPHTAWPRLAVYPFDPGQTEFTTVPEPLAVTKPQTVTVFDRKVLGRDEYQLSEDTTEPDGTLSHNSFPVFSGQPDWFVFYNSVARDVPVPGEYQSICRTVPHQGEEFLACRTLTPSKTIIYELHGKQP
ncbi:hypothetical protein [Amycolatopsis anabasis]|uniref:hypothetical protein n=1 Tax=Amycolatopsis anabasis TaxID=1840409 RepID=UPI00131C1802|nr:hypothetical protein [Amycolatopsis anabasis]